MKRRTFVTIGATAMGSLPLWGAEIFERHKNAKPAWLLEWIKIHDQQLPGFKNLKVTDPKHPFLGGYMDDVEIPNPHTTAGFIGKACMLMSCPESSYYRSKEVLKDIEEATKALLKMQHSDGTIDLLSTNFHSTPDTAFVLENIVPAYTFLKKSIAKGSETALELLKTFLKNAGEALTVGGIHTPNHRWVVSAALTKLNELFPDPRYVNRIEQWLAEHIDIDADGQYNEKSTNSYSPIVNRSLIIIAKGLNKPELLEPVRKNLIMTFYYVHPNGEVVTEASNRQDKGTIGNMSRYYYAYRFMALTDNSGEMAAMTRLIEKTSTKEQLAGYLDYFLEDPNLWKELPASKALPTNYAKAFPYSGVVRIRRENWDATILSNNASWITFHKGNAVLQAMRIAASFFGKGQFDSVKVDREGNAWVLRKSLDGPYYQPIAQDKIDPNGDWDKMPRTDRPQSEIQKMETIVKISEVNNGLQIDIEMSGTEGVPVSFELIFRAGGTFSGVTRHPKKDNAYLLTGESGSYTVNNDTIQFGPGKAEHKGIQLRGALPAMEAPTVYLTGFTPFKHTLTLR
ncbi:hypothetical protein [Runella slithyformis]|uniref:Uncharacterized protein n=1 Tax=Runella slithyformis (strain ATCC 29530 / DSM 19594 / LMG 11500 / NCIMB 11436 / LSU 4) TaxID=761193 RepID=A0A7U3ZNP4_RUNSL|nr:hypothetical protein [Runella slithyformis]AEI50552.1 hypothetical protein Runsl_4208 [Runella slithyformis DSM 19594]